MKILAFLLAFVILISCLCYFNDRDFSVVEYTNGLQSAPSKPVLPDWNYVQSGENIFERAGNFFIYLGQCIAYPFAWIQYITQTIGYITGGYN